MLRKSTNVRFHMLNQLETHFIIHIASIIKHIQTSINLYDTMFGSTIVSV